MANGKLVCSERTISIYEITTSPFLSDPVQSINIDIIPLEKLQAIITASPDDPLLYNTYALEVNEINMLNEWLSPAIIPDFTRFDYWLECYGV